MEILKRIFRWALALFFLVGAYGLFRIGISLPLGPGAFVFLVAMFFCILIASALLLPESLPFVSRPFTAIIDGIYGTGPGRGRPPFDCNLARGYAKQRRHEEALQEYQRVMKFHPRQLEPYRELIAIHLREFRDEDAAARVLHRGLRKVRSAGEREELKQAYEEEMARLSLNNSDIPG